MKRSIGEVEEEAPESGTAEDAEVSAEAEAEAEMAEAAFAKVRKNRVACLSLLCKHAQRIERVWDKDVKLRRALLTTFSACLASLVDHKEKVLHELASLAPKINAEASLRHFLTIALPIERQHTRGLRDDEFLVTRSEDLSKASPYEAAGLSGDVIASEGERMGLIVVCDHLRSAFNVGSIFRTAECLKASHLHLCGYTATPNDTAGQTGRAAMGTDVHVPWDHRERAHDVVRELKARGVPVYALETVADAASAHEFSFPRPCALLLGNERHGIEADLLALCDAPIRIPCHGVKNSLNVGVAFAICAYEIARQWKWDGGATATSGTA